MGKVEVEKRSTKRTDTYDVRIDDCMYRVRVTFVNGAFHEVSLKDYSSYRNQEVSLSAGEAKALFEVLKVVLVEEKLEQS